MKRFEQGFAEVFILLFIAIIIFGFVVIRFGIKSGTAKFALVNDSGQPVTFTVLHDDGDSSENKSLARPKVIDTGKEAEFNVYGATYCVYLLGEDGQEERSFELKDGVTPPHETRATDERERLPVYRISALEAPCEYDLSFQYD